MAIWETIDNPSASVPAACRHANPAGGLAVDMVQAQAFLTLAGELHFGRAAERLHVSQPRIRRLIAALDPLGEQFCAQLQHEYAQMPAALDHARRAAREAAGQLRIGFRELVLFVSGLLSAHRRQIGTWKGTRRLGCYRQAPFALAWFRDKGDIPQLGAGFGLPQSTAYRYLDEVIGVLAARAPGLQEQLECALAQGTPYLILDGKVVDAGRCHQKTTSCKGKTIDVWYAGKTHGFGGNIQALFYPSGIPLWVSDVLPGNVRDLAAARESVFGVLRPFPAAMPVLADPSAIRAQDDHMNGIQNSDPAQGRTSRPGHRERQSRRPRAHETRVDVCVRDAAGRQVDVRPWRAIA